MVAKFAHEEVKSIMWFWYCPILCFGEGALDHLENVAGQKCFIVTDPDLVKLGMLKILTDKLDQYGKKYEVFKDVEPDPSEETCLKAAKQCQIYAPELIIALGGGSSIDTAKVAWVMYERPELGIDDMHPFQKMDLGKKAKLIAIPTTSGTGAEVTWAIVITRRRADGITMKLEQANKECIPTMAIIDPVFPGGMPPKLTAATGFDALGHSVEGLLATWHNDYSDAMGLHAMDLIFRYLPRAVKDGNDKEARERMHNAATMGGLDFGNSQAIIGHSMAHVLGAFFHVTHGIGVGLFLPYICQYCINDLNNKFAADTLGGAAKRLGLAHWTDDAKTAGTALINKIKALQKETNLPTKVADLKIDQAEFDKQLDSMVSQCLESSVGVMSPRSIGSEEFKKLFQYAWIGKDVDF